jgi:hypothetical protein
VEVERRRSLALELVAVASAVVAAFPLEGVLLLLAQLATYLAFAALAFLICSNPELRLGRHQASYLSVLRLLLLLEVRLEQSSAIH